ncbi:MAG: MBL fold metallo-hydrolase [Candidatus Neomarinimicrobiota bacterium]|nr:MBL fold metallo-hydrolase [Candidatus Neomarinimicrobiota bacterium]
MRGLLLLSLLLSLALAQTKVVLLGTGNPNANPERMGPSIAVIVNGKSYIVDFGPGVVRRASKAFENGIEEMAMPNLTHAFATHLHSDHTLGLSDLIFTPWVLDRKRPLQLYGPKGINAMASNILRAYREDIKIRTTGGQPHNKTGYKVIAHQIRPGVVFKEDHLTVTAFKVNHGKVERAYGYKFETKDKTVVISGDAAPSESIVEQCNGCDMLFHEVYSLGKFQLKPPEWKAYHSTYHTSTKELATIANRARPERLILYHQIFWGATEKEILKEILQDYSGVVISGKDLDVFE